MKKQDTTILRELAAEQGFEVEDFNGFVDVKNHNRVVRWFPRSLYRVAYVFATGEVIRRATPEQVVALAAGPVA